MEKLNDQSEWKYDSMGRKYRKVGSCIEYAATIQTTSGTVYVDDLDEHNKRIKEQAKQRIRSLKEASQKEPDTDCPFKGNSLHPRCKSNCAFYREGCIFASMGSKPTVDTKGKFCPFSGTCRETCTLYNNGCMFWGFARKGIE